MTSTSDINPSQINQEFLDNFVKDQIKPNTTYSMLDRGIELANNQMVSNINKSEKAITAEVDDDDEIFTSSFSDDLNSISCSCCSADDLAEMWCPHLVAGLITAFNQGLINSLAAVSGDMQISLLDPEGIAKSLTKASELGYHCISREYYPEVNIRIGFRNHALAIKLNFDQQEINQDNINDKDLSSSRELDRILVQILDEQAEWDDQRLEWLINNSHDISIALGLIAEYKSAVTGENNKSLSFAHDYLDCRVELTWQEQSLDLSLFWVLNDKIISEVDSEIIGNSTYWTQIDQTVYQLSPSAEEIIRTFGKDTNLNFNFHQAAPIIELVEKKTIPSTIFTVKNPELQPDARITEPEVHILIEPQNTNFFERGVIANNVNLRAYLTFNYPAAEAEQRVIYIPNRDFENASIETLEQYGFNPTEDEGYYSIENDYALDLIHNSNPLPANWRVEGLDEIQEIIKFSKLDLKVNINKSSKEKEDFDQNIDWFDCEISLSQNSAKVPLTKIFQTTNAKYNRWIQLDNGSWAEIPGGGIQKLQTSLGLVSANYKHSSEIKTNVTSAQAITLINQKQDNVKVKSSKEITALANKLSDFDEIKSINPSALFQGKLRAYQKDGLSWLNFLNEYKFGGILADEMGLGKTIQTLSLLITLKNSKNKDKKLTKPALVVAPTSVTTNWYYETKRFTPNLKVLLLQGNKRKNFFDKIKDYDVVITSYALLRIDRSVLDKQDFSYVILDEAQNIKNPLTATAKSAKAIKSDFRLALTGTPTENRPLELWSIFDFLMPNYLGSYEFFKNQIEKPILQEGGSIETLRLIRNKTKPFLLRRLKSDVEKQLPPKIEAEMPVSMTESQQGLYAQIMEEVRPQVMEAVDAKGVRGATISILSALLRLRQVCNHPNSIEGLKDLPGYDSGKFELLKELITESLSNKRKILLFSQFREMLAIIKRWLEKEGIKHLYLDGATKNRQDLVDQFNTDESVELFLISLKAGGTGLNLTAADTVIIYDPWWNPAVESQAIDRAHRIGQSKVVNVYRLVTENSIEQKIMNLKSKKANLAESLVDENSLSNLSLSKADLESLFSMDTPTD